MHPSLITHVIARPPVIDKLAEIDSVRAGYQARTVQLRCRRRASFAVRICAYPRPAQCTEDRSKTARQPIQANANADIAHQFPRNSPCKPQQNRADRRIPKTGYEESDTTRSIREHIQRAEYRPVTKSPPQINRRAERSGDRKECPQYG